MGMRVIVVGGGTSGHVNPAISIANEIRRRNSSAEILFIGTPNKIEADLVPKAGYKIEFIEVTGLNRRKSFKAYKYNIKSIWKFFAAKQKVKKIIKIFKPDIVIGTGGYVSAPVMDTAAKIGIKTVIHEQNAFAGVTTKMLANKVDKVLLSFVLSNELNCDKSKTVIVGNPVRQDFWEQNRIDARKKLGISEDEHVVLSTGGSLGARVVNEAFCEMAVLSSRENLINIYHSASRDYAYVTDKLKDIDLNKIHITEYIYNMSEIMAAADLIINRSGASTLCEIAAMGKPSILIPSPNVTENHQFYNAKNFVDAGAAIMIEEKDLNGRVLYELTRELVWDKRKLYNMGENAKKLAQPKAAENIYSEIMEVYNKK